MSDWPKTTAQPAPGDVVQVLMPESMAREFERRFPTVKLSPPLLFSEDDVPTYTVAFDPPGGAAA